ncbi:MAG: hypothetical protein H6Q73_2306 [Firmicutes bacterium]|nr:hypothetical protein [Bacillota bacterium]
MTAFFLCLAFAGIALAELPGLVKKKYWKESLVFAGLLLLGFCLSLFQIIGIKIPNPGSGIENLIKVFIRL